MGSIQFYCPVGERRIDSGIDMDEECYRLQQLQAVRVYCPWCNRMHRFLLSDGTMQPRPARTSQTVAS